MLQTNFVEFIEKGTQVILHFGEEKKGPIDNKVEALQLLETTAKEKNIALSALNRMKNKITRAKDLAEFKQDDDESSVEFMMLMVGPFGISMLAFSIGNSKPQPKEITFKVCNCDSEVHGYIHLDDDSLIGPCWSLEEGLQALEMAKADDSIKTDADYHRVKKQIEAVFNPVKEIAEAS